MCLPQTLSHIRNIRAKSWAGFWDVLPGATGERTAQTLQLASDSFFLQLLACPKKAVSHGDRVDSVLCCLRAILFLQGELI